MILISVPLHHSLNDCSAVKWKNKNAQLGRHSENGSEPTHISVEQGFSTGGPW